MYRKILKNIELAGPSYFGPVLAEVIRKVAHSGKMKYSIFLILTDGVVHDMEQTVTNIIEASSLPLSIIIVGVGSEKFTKMKILDSDNKVL